MAAKHLGDCEVWNHILKQMKFIFFLKCQYLFVWRHTFNNIWKWFKADKGLEDKNNIYYHVKEIFNYYLMFISKERYTCAALFYYNALIVNNS